VSENHTRSFTSNKPGEGSYGRPLLNADESWNRQDNTVTTKYDSATGKALGAGGHGTMESDDGFGNKTTMQTDTEFNEDILTNKESNPFTLLKLLPSIIENKPTKTNRTERILNTRSVSSR
jgi:hypothetical protein